MNHTLNHYKNYSKVQHNTNKFHGITHYPIRSSIWELLFMEHATQNYLTVYKIPFASCSNMRDPLPQLIKQIQIRNIINEEPSNFFNYWDT